MAIWERPYYRKRTQLGRLIELDVTLSISAGLEANKAVISSLHDAFKRYKVETVLDVGAGALRHTLPLLRQGYDVTAVEFLEAFARPKCAENLNKAQRFRGFSSLVYPGQFERDRTSYDAALLIFVMQVMPVSKERSRVLKAIHRKLRSHDGLLCYVARRDADPPSKNAIKVGDGWALPGTKTHHSFLRYYSAAETRELLESHGFKVESRIEGVAQGYLCRKVRRRWI